MSRNKNKNKNKTKTKQKQKYLFFCYKIIDLNYSWSLIIPFKHVQRASV